MPGLKSNRQLWGRDFPVGGEWDAGSTPLHIRHEQAGRWTVRRESERFVVVFHNYNNDQETLLEVFTPTEQGEMDAKTCAMAARENSRFF